MSTEACLTKINDLLLQIWAYYDVFLQLEFFTISGYYNKVASVMACYAKECTEPSMLFEEGSMCLHPIVIAKLSYYNLSHVVVIYIG